MAASKVKKKATTKKASKRVAPTKGSPRKKAKTSNDNPPTKKKPVAKPTGSTKKRAAKKSSSGQQPGAATASPKATRGAAGTQGASNIAFAGFPKDATVFLAELRLNNDRDWFKANQERYEASVREPTLAFIRALAPHLMKLSERVVASDKKVGGSMMRPQRDTRFAKDADPYKTNVGVHFRNVAGKDVHAPGFYFHFDPDSVFVGVGMWHPDAPSLAKIRKHVDINGKRWTKVLEDGAFAKNFEMGGDSLKRPPKGFDETHPMIEVLKRKDHIAVCNLDHELLYSKQVVATVAKRFQAANAFMQMLHDAIGVAY